MRPTNAAFDAAAASLIGPGKTGQDLVNALDVATLTAVLKYHVVGDARNAQAVLASSQIVMLDGNAAAIALKSGSPYIQNAKITSTDIQASNGIVHVIDAVILPPSLAKAASTSDQTIAAIAAGNPDFSTLVAALQKAGLVSVLNGAQKFTVFAPTNAAFDEAAKQLHLRNGMELVAELDVKTLTAVLTYHVIAGETKAAAVVAADQLQMLEWRGGRRERAQRQGLHRRRADPGDRHPGEQRRHPRPRRGHAPLLTDRPAARPSTGALRGARRLYVRCGRVRGRPAVRRARPRRGRRE